MCAIVAPMRAAQAPTPSTPAAMDRTRDAVDLTTVSPRTHLHARTVSPPTHLHARTFSPPTHFAARHSLLGALLSGWGAQARARANAASRE